MCLKMAHSLSSPLSALKAIDLSNTFKKKAIEGRPLNFGIVMPGVYRSAYPQAEDYGYLKSLGLKTIVYAKFPIHVQPTNDFSALSSKETIQTVTKKAKIDQSDLNSMVEVVLDRRYYPLLIHCNHGKVSYVTSIFCFHLLNWVSIEQDARLLLFARSWDGVCSPL